MRWKEAEPFPQKSQKGYHWATGGKILLGSEPPSHKGPRTYPEIEVDWRLGGLNLVGKWRKPPRNTSKPIPTASPRLRVWLQHLDPGDAPVTARHSLGAGQGSKITCKYKQWHRKSRHEVWASPKNLGRTLHTSHVLELRAPKRKIRFLVSPANTQPVASW